ncbi:MAG: FAD-dependent oxidoreductase [Nanoarchaeota archaeon]
MESKKRVVIIGGGFTGAYCAKRLRNNFDVTLIDNKEYFEFTPSVLKSIINPQNLKSIQIYHKDYLKNEKFVLGSVSEIKNNYVVVGKKKLEFDYLIIASGSKYNSPIKDPKVFVPQRGKEISEFSERIKEARSILIVGGGLVGVELSAEIATRCEKKEIMLIDAGKEILSRNNEKTRKFARNFLESKGTNIISDEKVISNKGNVFFTDKKRKIKADLVFMCTGIKSNSGFMIKNFKNKLNEKGQIRTNGFLQLDGCENIFVGGDVTDIAEEKTAQNSEGHARIIVENIKRIEKNGRLREYKTKPGVFVISLGKNNGIFEYGNFSFSGIAPFIMKKIIEIKTMWRYR